MRQAPRHFVTEYYLGGHGRDGQRGRALLQAARELLQAADVLERPAAGVDYRRAPRK